MKFTKYKTCNVKKKSMTNFRPKKGVSKVLTSILKKKKRFIFKIRNNYGEAHWKFYHVKQFQYSMLNCKFCVVFFVYSAVLSIITCLFYKIF